MWFHNGVILRDTTQHQLSTTFSDEMVTGTTSIQFPEMVRADSGVYRMVVSTDFGEEEIESSLRRKEVSFQVDLRGENSDNQQELCIFVVKDQL